MSGRFLLDTNIVIALFAESRDPHFKEIAGLDLQVW